MIIPNQKNIKIHFAGTEQLDHAISSLAADVNYGLGTAFPFVYKMFKNGKIDERKIIQRVSSKYKHYILDSGLFTLMFGSLKGKKDEAYLDKLNSEITYMQTVYAVFYFKDNTVLYLWSDEGIYNSKTLDMYFKKNVRAEYAKSKIFAEKAQYSNTKYYLSVYENVRVNDVRGDLIADKLLFDITTQTLDITSFNNGKINANVNLNEKRF